MFFILFFAKKKPLKRKLKPVEYDNLKIKTSFQKIPVLLMFLLFSLIMFFSFYNFPCFKFQLLITVAGTTGFIIYCQTIMIKEKIRLCKKAKKYSEKLENKILKKKIKIKKILKNQKQMMLNVSHNLQTPLTIIKAELEYIIKEEVGTKNNSIKNSCKTLEKSIDKLSDFIYGLLYLSKLENLENKIKMKKINLSELLESLCEYFYTLSAYKKIILQKNIEPNIKIIGNKNKIEEIIINLLSNSMKYIGSGNLIKISLNLKNEKAVIKIEDNGIGIKEENLKKIFNRFFCSNKNGIKGSGLGLAIVKKLVDLHNGTIKVRSKEGKGTVFKIYFKAKE